MPRAMQVTLFSNLAVRHSKNTDADRSSQASLAFCITLHACSFLNIEVVCNPQKAGSISTTGVFKEIDHAFGEAG